MSRKIWRPVAWSVAIAGALFVAAAVLAPLFVDADRFRPGLERRLSETLGTPVSLGKLTLSLWSGIAVTADRLRAGGPGSAGGALVEASTVRVRVALLPLLGGQVHPRKVTLEDGTWTRAGKPVVKDLRMAARLDASGVRRARIRGRAEGIVDALPGGPRARVDFAADFDGDRLTIEDLDAAIGRGIVRASGTIEGLRSPAPRGAVKVTLAYGETRADGAMRFELPSDGPVVDFDLRATVVDFDALLGIGASSASPHAGLFPAAWASAPPGPRADGSVLNRMRASGRLEAARGRFEGLEVSGLRSRVRLERGKVFLDDATFAMYGGNGSASCAARLLDPGIPFEISTRLSGVQVQPVLQVFSPDLGTALEGTGSVSADLVGVALRGDLARSLRGTASVGVASGKLRSFGLMKQVAQILELAGGRGIGKDETVFERVSASFQVDDGVARTGDLEFRSADLDLDGGGTVAVDGTLQLDVVSTFSGAASADMVRKTPQLRFRVGGDGRLSIPMQVRGTVKSPVIRLDLERVLREGLRLEIRDRGAKGLIEKLLGR